MRRVNKLILLLCLLLFALQSRAQSGRIPVASEKGMVVSSHHLASDVGSRILQKGGNAVDAAVATAFALAVTLPSAGNIGGGGFLVYHGANGHVTTFNFREKAPLAATATMYLDEDGNVRDDINHEGPLAVGGPRDSGWIGACARAAWHAPLGRLSRTRRTARRKGISVVARYGGHPAIHGELGEA